MSYRKLVLVLALLQGHAYALSVNETRAYVIDQEISRGNILDMGKEILELSTKEDKEPVDIILSSPGGDVVTGFMFISMLDAARNNGLKVRCFVPTMAASMAFGILVHCDERHTLNNAFLLWHRARTVIGGLFGQPMTAPDLLSLGRQLNSLDSQIFDETFKALGAPSSYVRYHFERETLHLGSNLAKACPKFIQTHSHIDGLMEALLFSKKVKRIKKEEMFSFKYKSGQFIYISPNLTQSLGK